MNYQLLDELLKAKGLSRRQLAQKCGIAQGTISNWYARHTEKVPLKLVMKIADVLEVQWTRLLGIDEQKEVLKMAERVEFNPVGGIVTDDHLKPAPEKDAFSDENMMFDYVTNGQIMVKITLSEYRKLLLRGADDKVSEARSKRWEAERERDELKKEVADLRKQLDGLRTMIASAASARVQNQEGPDGNV